MPNSLPIRWVVLAIAALLASAGALAQVSDANRNLSAAVEPLWVDLTEQQRQVLKPFESQWNTWPSEEKKVWVVLANRFPEFSPRAKGRAMVRIKEWAALSQSERETARQNYQLARERGKAEREAEWRQYQQMTPEQQSVLRDNGSISNTAAGRAAPTGLARDAAQPLSIFPVMTPRKSP